MKPQLKTLSAAKSPHNTEADEVSESLEFLILSNIYENELINLKKLKVTQRDLNYLIHFPEVDLESKISPIILASYLGRYDCAKILLENPFIDVDLATSDTGYTPLCIACLTGNYEIVKLLLDADAEVNKPTKLNDTALKLCFNRLNEETNLYENKKICFKMSELLLDHGSDINWIIDKTKGHTLLMKFCGLKIELSRREADLNLEVIRFLIEHGANKYIKSIKNKNAFDIALKHSNKDKVLEVLNTVNLKYIHQNIRRLIKVPIALTKKKTQTALNSKKYHSRSNSTITIKKSM